MKSTKVIYASIALALSVSSVSQAAIVQYDFKCGGTHGVNNYPIPDAPLYSLECDLYTPGLGNPQGSASCTLISSNIYPMAQKNETPLRTTAYTKGIGQFDIPGVTVRANFKTGVAKIKLDFGSADCTYKSPEADSQN
ncbi:MAG: hypothetical protein ACXVCP_09260 [Bdellovibrio sp.]